MQPGQSRVLVLIIVLIGLEVIANPAFSGFFKGIVGGFWNLGGK
jgi:hypothetical protein